MVLHLQACGSAWSPGIVELSGFSILQFSLILLCFYLKLLMPRILLLQELFINSSNHFFYYLSLVLPHWMVWSVCQESPFDNYQLGNFVVALVLFTSLSIWNMHWGWIVNLICWFPSPPPPSLHKYLSTINCIGRCLICLIKC